jgi:hypothetical protein
MTFQAKFSARKALCVAAITLAGLTISLNAKAGTTIDVLVGNKNNFGFADCTDTGTCPDLVNPSIDNRTAAEMAATNGAQFTDVYSALFPGEGPNTTFSGDVIFSFAGTLTDGTISIATDDFQSDSFGPFAASIDGTSVPFSFADGRFVTAIHTFTLTASELAVANSQGFVDLNLNRNGSTDFVAFDWFELNGDTGTAATPEPSSLALLGCALAGLGLLSMRSKRFVSTLA